MEKKELKKVQQAAPTKEIKANFKVGQNNNKVDKIKNELKVKNTKPFARKDNRDSKSLSKDNNNKRNFKKREQNSQPFQNEFEEKVINISRVTTVVKGGRRFSFSAYAVVGNKKGKVGFGHGKANEVQDSIKKAIKAAQNNLITVPIVDSTVPHEIQEKFLASKVLLKPAPKGKGIIASASVRAVVELAGYSNIYTKTYGSRTKANIVRATMNALSKLRTVEKIAELRNIPVEHLKKN
ncbi:30S ribosomal protein S5 [Mesomycoplasma neurolyticum]|uniref:Small ribosomal subunit protein uS5 n=1 Tax=Mesomycoplasma neurolyticum TaxID=2120 RepID=A0A449A6G1_9BACT|nr:30S ribosomal protein S5 [Mesomycoplasma neurolyticum]